MHCVFKQAWLKCIKDHEQIALNEMGRIDPSNSYDNLRARNQLHT
jgi:hypothetical protein